MPSVTSKNLDKFRDGWPFLFFFILLIANLALLLPQANPLRSGGALLLISLLPGLGWANQWLETHTIWLRATVAAALSVIATTLITLLLHYLPGPVQAWQIIVSLNFVALLPFLVRSGKHQPHATNARSKQLRQLVPLLAILGLALFLRATNLGYSEFQGDEALALISAAEALEGHEDALFLRSKGPGEVLLPMALWRLTGIINEATARAPFTLAALWAIVTLYLIGQARWSDRPKQDARLGLSAATLFYAQWL